MLGPQHNDMEAVPQRFLDALSEVYDPCCRERGISVVDMGLVRTVRMQDVDTAEVEVVWDEAWTTDRLSPSARRLLRFLPEPVAVPDRDAYVAVHQPAWKGDPS